MKKLSRRETYHSQIHNEEEYERELVLVESFNADGKIIQSQTMGQVGEPALIEERSYTDGRVSEIRTHDIGLDVHQLTEFKYDEDRIVEETEHFENNAFVKRIMQYDAEHRVIEIMQTDEEQAFLGKTVYSYDTSSKTEKKYDEENFLFEEHRRVFDEQGNEVEHEMTEYLYDEYKKETEETRTLTKREFAGSLLIKEVAERFGKIIFVKTNVYDAANNLLKTEVRSNEIAYVLSLAYSYNSDNLRTSETHFRNDTEVYSKHLHYDSEQNLEAIIENQLAQDGFIISSKKSMENSYH